MSLDLGPALASGAPGSSGARGLKRAVPRVFAVVHATTPDDLVAALAGVAAQSRQPDVLIGVDALGDDIALPLSGAASHGHSDTNTDDLNDLNTGELEAVQNQQAFVETFAEIAPEQFGEAETATATETETGTETETQTERPEATDLAEDEMLRDADGRRVVDQGETVTISPVAVRGGTARDVLAAHCDGIVTLPAKTSTTAAVEAALAWADANPEDASQHASDPEQYEDWIWLLGDTDRASMKALEHLLDQVRLSTTVAVVGGKHRAGPTGRDLVDVGLTTTRFGRILSFVEPGEPDQGQRDDTHDTLAVSLSGLLIRRDVWQQLKGLDPALDRSAPTDAAVDLCRRVWLAGHRVVVTAPAVFTAPPEVTRPAVSRRARTHRRLSGAPLLAVPFIALSVLLGAVLRLLGGLVAKEPVRALALAAASLAPLLRPDRVLRARWRAWRSHRVPRRQLRNLLATPKDTWRWQRDRWQRTRPRLISPAGSDVEPIRWGSLATLAGLLALASVVALHRIVNNQPFSSAATLEVPASLTDTWRAIASSWVPVGLGQPGPGDPMLSVIGALGGPFLSPRLAVLVLLLTALPLAGWSAWWAAGGLTRRRAVRLLVGLAWAGSPLVLLGIAGARLPIVLAAVFLPLAVRSLGQAVAAHAARAAWAWAALGGLLLVPAVSGLPLLGAALALVLLVVAARTRRLSIAFAALPSVVVLLPIFLATRRTPALLFAEAGLALDRGSVPSWFGLFGWAQAPAPVLTDRVGPPAHDLLDPLIGADIVTPALNALPFVLGALPLLLALAGARVLLRGTPRGAVARGGWLLVALGSALAWSAPHFVVGVGATGEVRADPAAGVLLIVTGLLVAAAAGWGVRGARKPGFAAASARFGASVLVGVVALLPLLTIAGWSSQQLLDPPAGDVRSGAKPPLPQVVLDTATSADQTRTVVVRADARADDAQLETGLPPLQVTLVRGAGNNLTNTAESATLRASAENTANQALADAVARTLRGDGDARTLLAPFGVGAIVLQPGPDDDRLAANLDSAVGLGPVGQVQGVRAWRVDAVGAAGNGPDRPSAVRLVPTSTAGQPAWYAIPSANGRVETRLAAVPAGTLVTGERFDTGWQASVDGTPLKPVRVDGWAQGFELPAGSGELSIGHTAEWQRTIGWTQLGVLLLAVLIAVPVRSREGENR